MATQFPAVTFATTDCDFNHSRQLATRPESQCLKGVSELRSRCCEKHQALAVISKRSRRENLVISVSQGSGSVVSPVVCRRRPYVAEVSVFSFDHPLL